MSLLKKFFAEEDGQDLVEYGLVIALLVAAAAGILGTYFGSITTGFTAMGTNIKTNVIK
jgi:Flp pilus assembly pilin Flp